MSANVLIVQPDAALAERIGRLILADHPDASVGFVSTPGEGIAALEAYADLDLCVCEVYFPDADGLAFLAALRTRFRRARVIVVSAYNLQHFAEYLQGLTLFPLPLDEAVFRATCQDALHTLEGLEFPPFRLGKKQPPDEWGDCYAAYDTGVKRDVFITVIRPEATPEQGRHFRDSAAAMARAGHPNVQAVYHAGRHEDRDFFAREKWEVPNLVEMALAGRGIDSRLAARIVYIVGSVIIFWDSHGHPHRRVGATDVSVSAQGIIKVANCVDPALAATPPGTTDLTGLAAGLLALLRGAEIYPRTQALLDRLGAGPVPLAEVTGEAQAIDIDLAPQREIAISQERRQARRAVELERRKQQRNLYVLAASSILVVAMAAYLLYSRFFAPDSTQAFNEMAAIPAGPYTYQDAPATLDHSFYIDKYEVTFRQYLNFLRAVRKAGSDAAWCYPGQKPGKNHEPDDWPAIFAAIKYQRPYHNENLTLDFPVFNVDWYDAQAFAKWAGKRLPNEHEWEKAARGPQGFIFPWGSFFQPLANTAVPAPGSTTSQGRALLAVDQNPGDESPYGVYDMAGNVSEWTADLAASSRLGSEQIAVIRGANFLSRSLDHEELTNRITDYVPTTREPWLGFRCAADKIPAPPKR